MAKQKQKLSAGARTAKLNRAAQGLLRDKLRESGRFDEYQRSTAPTRIIPDKRNKGPKHKGKDDFYR